jgi:hypothetical protein
MPSSEKQTTRLKPRTRILRSRLRIMANHPGRPQSKTLAEIESARLESFERRIAASRTSHLKNVLLFDFLTRDRRQDIMIEDLMENQGKKEREVSHAGRYSRLNAPEENNRTNPGNYKE